MPIPLNQVAEFCNIHQYFDNLEDFQNFLEGLPSDRYPQSELKRLSLMSELEFWLQQSEENQRTFFGLTFLYPVRHGSRGDRWTQAHLFRCIAVKTPDGKLHGLRTQIMSFDLEGAYS